MSGGEPTLQDRAKEITRRIDELEKHHKRASQLADHSGKKESAPTPPLPI